MSDLISRQAAIDAIDHICPVDTEYDCTLLYRVDVRYVLSDLPSAQPDIIRCKDCKFYGRADKRRFYRGSDCLNNRIDTIVPDRDFCSKAERREE